MVQWFRLCTPSVEGPVLIPCGELRSYMLEGAAKKQNEKITKKPQNIAEESCMLRGL